MNRAFCVTLSFFFLISCARPYIHKPPASEVQFIVFDELEIDSSESVVELIAEGNYDEVELRLLNNGSPLSNGPRCGAYNCRYRRSVQLARFNSSYATSYIAERLRARGLRPANAQELIAFGNNHPNEQWFYPIVALGSIWQTVEGDQYVAVIGGEYGRRTVYLHWTGEVWPPCYRFLAARQENR